jgi:hypothetical protein
MVGGGNSNRKRVGEALRALSINGDSPARENEI